MSQKALFERIRAEFLEMPGLQLTVEQAGRFCGLQGPVCQVVLDALVDAKFLWRKSNGVYARVTEGDISRRRSSDGPMAD